MTQLSGAERPHPPVGPGTLQQSPRILLGAAVLVAATLGGGCSTAPRVDDYTVRGEVHGAYVFQPLGLTRASEDPEEGALAGDSLKWQRDLDLQGGPAWGTALSVRPLLNDELRISFRRAGELTGRSRLGRARRFDGRTYGAGEKVRSRLAWQTLSAELSHRILALGNPEGPSGPLADILLRAGGEATTFDTEIEGEVTPEESRQLRSGAPFVGLEGRAHVMPRTIFVHSLQAGYWNFDGARLGLLEATAGFRVKVVGPLEALLRYEFLLRDARARLSDGEVSRVALQTHLVTLGLSLQF